MQGPSGISIREGWYLRHRPGLEIQIWGHLKTGIEAKRGKHPERKGNTESQYRSHKTTVSRRSLRRPLRRDSSITGESRVQTRSKRFINHLSGNTRGKGSLGWRRGRGIRESVCPLAPQPYSSPFTSCSLNKTSPRAEEMRAFLKTFRYTLTPTQIWTPKEKNQITLFQTCPTWS